MRATITTAFLSMFCAYAIASPKFEGMWLTCESGIHTRGQHTLRVIKLEGGRYVYGEEWGQNYSRSGTGTVVGDRLIVRGCTSFRGEVVRDCDEKNPPVIFTLNGKSAAKMHKSATAALGRGETVRVTKSSWERLSFVCEERAEKLEARRNKQNK
jgi:hypothetical protein